MTKVEVVYDIYANKLQNKINDMLDKKYLLLNIIQMTSRSNPDYCSYMVIFQSPENVESSTSEHQSAGYKKRFKTNGKAAIKGICFVIAL
jgi:hypothetical protein